MKEDKEPRVDGKRLDEYPVAVAFNRDGTIEIGSSDTPELKEFLEKLREQGVEVDFEGVVYGLPWCG